MKTPEEIRAGATPEEVEQAKAAYIHHRHAHQSINAAKTAVAVVTAHGNLRLQADTVGMYVQESGECPYCIFDLVVELSGMARGLLREFVCEDHEHEFLQDAGRMLAQVEQVERREEEEP